MDKALTITPQFRERIEATGMTQEALAKAVGVTRQYFNQVINGKTPVTTAFLVGALKAGLGKEITDIAQWAPKKAA